MQRIHFTVEDMARTRLGPVAGQSAETAFAMSLFGRGGGGVLFGEWRRDVRHRLVGRAAEALDGLTLPMAEDFNRIAISPYWKGIFDYLEMERESRARIMLDGGIQALFASLHPQLHWEAPTLSVPTLPAADVKLEGRGLVLVPSLFLFDRVIFMDEPESPLLIYPTRLNKPAAEMLWQATVPSGRALSALIGRTRAGALRALTKSYTTSELGNLLRISPAAASQHATTLRNAGLITTRRRLNAVQHAVTPLGAALIRGHNSGGDDDVSNERIAVTG